MLTSLPAMAGTSIKPYAVMDFDSLIATALTGGYTDPELPPGHTRHDMPPHTHGLNSPDTLLLNSSNHHLNQSAVSPAFGHSNLSLSTSWTFQQPPQPYQHHRQQDKYIEQHHIHQHNRPISADPTQADAISVDSIPSFHAPTVPSMPDMNSNFPSPELPPRHPLLQDGNLVPSVPHDLKSPQSRGRLMSEPLLDDERSQIRPDLNSSLPIIDVDLDYGFLPPSHAQLSNHAPLPQIPAKSRSPFTSTMVPFPATLLSPPPPLTPITPVTPMASMASMTSLTSITPPTARASHLSMLTHTPVSEQSTPRAHHTRLSATPPRGPTLRGRLQGAHSPASDVSGGSGPVHMHATHLVS